MLKCFIHVCTGYNFKSAEQALARYLCCPSLLTYLLWTAFFESGHKSKHTLSGCRLLLPLILNHGSQSAEKAGTTGYPSISELPISSGSQGKDFNCRSTRHLRVKQAMRNKHKDLKLLTLQLPPWLSGRGRTHIPLYPFKSVRSASISGYSELLLPSPCPVSPSYQRQWLLSKIYMLYYLYTKFQICNFFRSTAALLFPMYLA